MWNSKCRNKEPEWNRRTREDGQRSVRKTLHGPETSDLPAWLSHQHGWVRPLLIEENPYILKIGKVRLVQTHCWAACLFHAELRLAQNRDYAWHFLNKELASVSSCRGFFDLRFTELCWTASSAHGTVLKSVHIIWFLTVAALFPLFMSLSFTLQAPTLVGFIYSLNELAFYCCLNKLHNPRGLNSTSFLYLFLN